MSGRDSVSDQHVPGNLLSGTRAGRPIGTGRLSRHVDRRRLRGRMKLQAVTSSRASETAALAFGLIHLPQLAQFGTPTLTPIAITLLGNGIVGVVCGWLYWRRSLVAAILAHFAVDLILHVLPAIGT